MYWNVLYLVVCIHKLWYHWYVSIHIVCMVGFHLHLSVSVYMCKYWYASECMIYITCIGKYLYVLVYIVCMTCIACSSMHLYIC